VSARILSVEDVDGVPITSTQVRSGAASVGATFDVTATLGLAESASAAVSSVVSVSGSMARTQPVDASVSTSAAITAAATPTRVGAASVASTVATTAAAQLLWQYDFDGGTAGADAPSPVTIGGLGFNTEDWGTLPLVADSDISGDLAVRMPEGTNAGLLFTTHTRTGNFWLRAEVQVTDLLVPMSVFLVSKGPVTAGFPDYGGYQDYNLGYTVAAGFVGSPGSHGTTPGIFVGTMTHQDSSILGNDADLAALDDMTITAIPGGWPSGPMRLEFQWAPDTNTGIQLKCWLDPTSTGTPDATATSSASWVNLKDADLNPWPLRPRVGASTDAVGWAVGARGSDESTFGPLVFLDTGHVYEFGAVGFSADSWVGPWR
jgi:hypothetical protein